MERRAADSMVSSRMCIQPLEQPEAEHRKAKQSHQMLRFSGQALPLLKVSLARDYSSIGRINKK